MPEAIENYVPQTAAKKIRRQAIFIWIVAAVLVLIWNSLIVAAPLAESGSLPEISNPLYKFFGYLCHQMSARSFYIFEQPLAVCARCFGVYVGLLIGFIVYPFLRPFEETEPIPRFWLFVAMIPIAVDWLLGIFGFWENTHISRFITGAILGTACTIFIIPALIEIARFLPRKK